MKEVHFVDINAEVVNLIQAACLLNITGPGIEVKHKLQKIPESVKETFVSYIGEEDTTTKYKNIHLANNLNVTVCDGPLFTAYRHRHMKVDAIAEFEYEDTAVVITEDTEFRGKSRSASHCLQRCGNDFYRCYDQLKKSKEKKKVCKAFDTFGDHTLNYGYVIYTVMPSVNKKQLTINSKELMPFFANLSECCRNVLKKAEKCGIRHLCLPLLGEGEIILHSIDNY